MKTLRFLIFGFLATACLCSAQVPMTLIRKNVSLTQHAAAVAAKQAQLAAQPRVKTLAQQPAQNEVPAAPIAEVITPDIQALADGLQDDPVRIFNFVHDRIRHVLYFGSRKGAELTLLEKSGNDFDQCALLVALLNAAGYTNTAYQFGWMELPYDSPDHQDLHHWLQLTLVNTNWNNTANYLANFIEGRRGYPDISFLGDGNTCLFQREWVALTIGSTTYYLDPSFKVNEPIAGINLPAAMGFSSGTALSNALMNAVGGVDTGDYVTNLNEAALRSSLTGYTTNLLNYIQSNCPNASVEQILSGWQIVPSTNTTLPTSTDFPTYTWNGQMPILTWTYEPTNMMSTLTIGLGGSYLYGWYMPQLEGQRLTLTFDDSGLAQLWQDDTPLTSAQTDGYSYIDVEMYVHHPVGYWDTNNNVFVDTGAFDSSTANYYQDFDSTYNFIYGFDPDWGWLQKRQNQLDNYRQQGFSDNSRQVVSETLNVMGLNYMLESWYMEQILAAQAGVLPHNDNFIGRIGQQLGGGYFFDIFLVESADMPNSGLDADSIDRLDRCEDMISYFGSAFEHGVIEQLQDSNLDAVSTMKILEIANTNGQAIFLANSNNWASVQGQLYNYSSSDINNFSSLVSYGDTVLLPQNGANALGSWNGYGYVDYSAPGALGSIIVGGYLYGGAVSDPNATVNSAYVANNGQAQPNSTQPNPLGTPDPTAADPVDMASGTLPVEHADLTLGQGEPRGITLSRYYNGTRRYDNTAGMAPGWVNNYSMSAQAVAAPQACLGGTTPAQSASMIAATRAALSTYSDANPDPKNWTVAALISKWAIDQLDKTGVSIQMGKDTVQFIQQPDGSFTPPGNCTMILAQNGPTYSLQQRRGNIFNFDSLGRLTNIVDPYSQQLTVAYLDSTDNLVQTVTDWKGRSLTFNYTGTPAQLTSVSDSIGRSVSYGYDTAGDLTSVTDPDNNTWTYGYDSNHDITAIYNALNQLVVSNNYDANGRVTTQLTEGDANQTWHIFWSGWQTVVEDPAGGQQTYFYDDQSRLIGTEDALGNLTQTYYDGQNHVVTTVSPLGETNETIYDGNNNVIEMIDPLGFTNRFFYDAQNNLIESVDRRGDTNSFGYNAEFSLTGQTNGAGDFVNYAYNSDSTLASRTDAGGTTTYGYDSYGELNSIVYPDNLGSESFVNDALGDMTSHTDANGNTTTFGYNNRRQLTNTVAPANLTTSIAYDPIGNVLSTTDARGNTTVNTWSATRKLLTTTLPVIPAGTPIITNIYDDRDWLIETLDPLQNATLYGYDAAERLISLTDPVQRAKTFGYDADGRKLTTVNAANETNSQTWDARDDLIAMIDGAGHTSLRGYDAAGNQITLTNRNGKVWQFRFDGANRLTNTISPLGRSMSLAFNQRGLLASSKDPAGQTTSYSYDANGRLTSRADNAGTILYGYDDNGNRTNAAEAGVGTNSWTYDAYDRISSYRDAYGNLIQYRYDGNGNLTNIVYPGGKDVYYAYDSENHMTNVTDWANRQTTLTYDLAGRLATITRPNGTERIINYDAAGEMTNIIEETAEHYPIAVFVHNWNAAVEMQWEFAAPLPHANSAPTRTMTYNDDNELATVDGQNVMEDADGNMTYGPLTNDNLVTYTYDARNRLLNAGGTTNAYDAMNNRIGQTYGSNSVIYVINPNAKLSQALMSIKNGVTNYYIYGPGLLYQVTETPNGERTLTYHYDYRGSTIALTDDNGNIVDRFEYSLYATMTYRSGMDDTPFLFNGEYGVMTDPNGLLYMRARYYNSYICRFINPDPKGFSGGLNFYAFVANNPVDAVDPDGLTWTSNWNFFWSWASGSGQQNRFYGPNTTETKEMETSPGGNALRNAFYSNGGQSFTGGALGDYGTVQAYWDTIANPYTASWSGTGAQVGGFAGASAINNGNGTVTFTIQNTAGTHSFFLHLVPNVPDQINLPFIGPVNTPGRNIYQTFQWTEKIK